MEEIFERLAIENGWDSTTDVITKGQFSTIYNLLKESGRLYAIEMCKEQREICANELVSNGLRNRINILQAPLPEELHD